MDIIVSERLARLREDNILLTALLAGPDLDNADWNDKVAEVTGRMSGVSDAATLARARKLLWRYAHPSRLGQVPSDGLQASLSVADSMLTWAGRQAGGDSPEPFGLGDLDPETSAKVDAFMAAPEETGTRRRRPGGKHEAP